MSQPEESSVATPENATDPFPKALVQTSPTLRRWFASRLWWLTITCGVISLFLFWYARLNTGDLISIEFRDGHGLKPEDRLTFRGIDIGSVEKIELNPSRDAVLVHVRLTTQARPMAAEGAKFWIVRPLLSFDSIQGLDTLLGAKYIAIDPPAIGSRLQAHFVGADSAPIIAPPNGSLEISLDANTRGGLENGAPILFRGFRIGNVVQVGLANDARTVRARCAIEPEYRDLVRKNSKFWNRSGWRLDIGLTGIRLDADTLSQVVSGGIEMATPTEPAVGVSTGHRFILYDKPEAEWVKWQPSMAHGQSWSRLESSMPQPIRIALRWQERSFGFRRDQQKSAWCVPLDDGSILCLLEQMALPKSALADSIRIELAGMSLRPDQLNNSKSPMTPEVSLKSVGRFYFAEAISDITTWSELKVSPRLPEELCDVIIAHADTASSIAIDSARLKISSSGWEIDDLVAVDRDYHGLPVVSAKTGQIIGVISFSNKQRLVVN